MRAPAPTRRRILHGAGIGGVGLIAGCFDGDDDHRGRDGDSDADGNDAAGEVHFLTAYDDVLESDAFRSRELFRAHPHLLGKLESVREEFVGDHYGSVDEADLPSPAALYVRRQLFYGGILNRVVTDSMTQQTAYDWGYERLEESFADARERFGD